MTQNYIARPTFDDLPSELQEATTWAPVDATDRVDAKAGCLDFSGYDVADLAGQAKYVVRSEHLPAVPRESVFMVPGERGSAEVRHETDAYLLRLRIDLTLLVSFKSNVEPWSGAAALLSEFLAEDNLVDRAGCPLQPEESRELTGGGTFLRYRTPPPYVGRATGLYVYGSPQLLVCCLPILIDLKPNPLEPRDT